jgi:hypothetical protein
MLSNNKWLVLVVVSTALFLISIDMTVLYTALPRLTHDLVADNSRKLWIVDAILGSILSFTYTKALILPQGNPAPALAKDSLDQALLLAEHLSGDAAVKLITQAKAAFDIAFVTVLIAGTAIMLLMAAVIARITSRAKTPEPSHMPHS